VKGRFFNIKPERQSSFGKISPLDLADDLPRQKEKQEVLSRKASTAILICWEANTCA
jgi:hypothetical protein